jgi:hypothetical protein
LLKIRHLLAGVYPSEKWKSRNTKAKIKFKSEKIGMGKLGFLSGFLGFEFGA